MEVRIKTEESMTVVELAGSLDSNTSPDVQGQLMPLIVPECRLILDVKECEYVSSAGLRVLLMLAKNITKVNGKGVVASLSEEVKDVMEMTGFDHMFSAYDTAEQAARALTGE